MLPYLGQQDLCWDLDGLVASDTTSLASRDGGRGQGRAGVSLGNLNLTTFYKVLTERMEVQYTKML